MNYLSPSKYFMLYLVLLQVINVHSLSCFSNLEIFGIFNELESKTCVNHKGPPNNANMPIKEAETVNKMHYLMSAKFLTSKNELESHNEDAFRANNISDMWQNLFYDESLVQMLTVIAKNEFNECFLTIIYEKNFVDTKTLRALFLLDISKQIVELSDLAVLEYMQWKGSLCMGFIFLIADSKEKLIIYLSNKNKWNHDGRYIFVAPNISIMNEVAETKLGKKTQHIAAIVPSRDKLRWLTYIKVFFDSPPMQPRTRKFNRKRSIFHDQLTDFRKTKLKLVTFEWRPNIFYEWNDSGDVTDHYGIDIEVAKTLAQILNFEIIYMEPPPNEYFGGKLPGGNWTGLVGMIYRDEADIAVADLFYTYERTGLVDFGGPFAVESTCFMAKTASPLPRWQAIVFPFKLEPWLAILVLLLISATFMYFLAFFNWSLNLSSTKPGVRFFMEPVRIHVNQPSPVDYPEKSMRIFLAFLSIYCLIITTAYSSSLTAFLTVKQLPKTFETIKELREKGLNVGGLGAFFEAASASEGNEDLKVLATRFKVYSTVQDLLTDVLKGKSVMLLNRLFLEYASVATLYNEEPDPKTNLRIMSECFSSFSTGMYLQKNSPYKEKFNTVIGRMLNGGLVRKWFWDSLSISNQKNLQKKQRLKSANAPRIKNSTKTEVDVPVSSQDNDAVVSLTLDHLQGIFFVLFVGYGIATIAFLLEIFCTSRKRLR